MSKCWHWEKASNYPSTDLVNEANECILQVYESHGVGRLPSESTMALIAAAPEMLEALKECYNYLEAQDKAKGLGSVGNAAKRQARKVLQSVNVYTG